MGLTIGSGLTDSTLVLNKSWIPINTTTVRHALVLCVKGAARLILPETYEIHDFETWCTLELLPDKETIRTPSLQVMLPEVIVLTDYNQLPGQKVPFSRRNLHRRDGNSCQYCGASVRASDMTIDHVIPKSRGGKNTWENCVVACKKCNSRKGNKALKESGLYLLREPVQPEWSPCLSTRKGQRRDSWRGFISDRHWAASFGS